MISNEMIGLLSFVVTVACYWVNKRLYRQYKNVLLMPIIATPVVLIVLALLTQVSFPQYYAQTHWLVWLLGPTTVAFALPLYEHRQLLQKHWMSIGTGVIAATVVSIGTSVTFAQWFGLPEELEKGLAVRSITTPFAIEAEKVLGGPTDLAALFVLLTGVYVAGRLDADSEGLLLLTNDGQLQAHIADPRHKMEKTYWVQVEGIPDEAALQRLRDGVELNDGKTLPAKVRLIEPQPQMWERKPPIRVRQSVPDCWIELIIREGRNRQVRRMTAAIGHPTLRLVRVAIGPYSIEGLEPGQWVDAQPV